MHMYSVYAGRNLKKHGLIDNSRQIDTQAEREAIRGADKQLTPVRRKSHAFEIDLVSDDCEAI